jgi:hypothetical protein
VVTRGDTGELVDGGEARGHHARAPELPRPRGFDRFAAEASLGATRNPASAGTSLPSPPVHTPERTSVPGRALGSFAGFLDPSLGLPSHRTERHAF